jgi:hypothetical protein
MPDPKDSVFRAEPRRLSALLDLSEAVGQVWQPEELGAILKHQLSAPVRTDLIETKESGTAGETPGPQFGGSEIQTFDDLFHHPQPPIELLLSVKEFAKANRNHPASVLPNEIATLLYFTSIVVAWTRCRRRITHLDDQEIRTGVEWALAQPWVDEGTKSLFRETARGLMPDSDQV